MTKIPKSKKDNSLKTTQKIGHMSHSKISERAKNIRFPLVHFYNYKVLLGKEGLVKAVHAINEAIKSLEKGSVLDGAEDWVSILTSSFSYSNPKIRRLYPVVGSPRFEVYSIDFGWGPPEKVDMVSRGINLSDSRNAYGGVEIGLAPKKNHMEAFASFFVQGLESL